jgi:hypothetical protein
MKLLCWRAGGMVHVIESLPSKCEALSSNPNTTKKTKKQKAFLLVFSILHTPRLLVPSFAKKCVPSISRLILSPTVREDIWTETWRR